MGKSFCKMSDLCQMKPFLFQDTIKNSSTISEHHFMTTSSLGKKSLSVKTNEGVDSQIVFSGLLMQYGML